MKPVDMCLGNIRRCCCCSLAAGTVTWTVIHVLGAVVGFAVDLTLMNILSSIISLLGCILLIWALVKHNWLPLLIVCGISACDVVINIINTFAVRVPYILKSDQPSKEAKIGGMILGLAIYILINLWFISVILSLANVYMVFGNGWEGKNWKEIQEENENNNKDNENTKREAEDDIEISH